MRTLFRRKKFRTEGPARAEPGAPHAPLWPHLQPLMLTVVLRRDFYALECLDNTLLIKELRTRYDGEDCAIDKRERLYHDMVEAMDKLWAACRNLQERGYVHSFLARTTKVFYDNMYNYMLCADKADDDEFVRNICHALAENEWRSAYDINTKYVISEIV